MYIFTVGYDTLNYTIKTKYVYFYMNKSWKIQIRLHMLVNGYSMYFCYWVILFIVG